MSWLSHVSQHFHVIDSSSHDCKTGSIHDYQSNDYVNVSVREIIENRRICMCVLFPGLREEKGKETEIEIEEGEVVVTMKSMKMKETYRIGTQKVWRERFVEKKM